MYYGFGRGAGGRGGSGFGFRGSSPPWPYVGRGRGGLPRCAYPGLTSSIPFTAGLPYTGQMNREEELALLKSQAEAIKKELDQVKARISELETSKKGTS
jgi:hypothetical protein